MPTESRQAAMTQCADYGASSGTKPKQVEFADVCQVIPNVDHRQLCKLLRLYALGCESLEEQGVEPERIASAPHRIPKRPRYGVKVVSVPLSPGHWGASNIKASLANLSLAKVDLAAIASGLSPAFAGPGVSAAQRRGSASPASASHLDQEADESYFALKPTHGRSFSDDATWQGMKVRGTSPASSTDADATSREVGNDNSTPVGSIVPDPIAVDAPRMLRMKLPTFTGWWKTTPTVANHAPKKGCLIRRALPEDPELSSRSGASPMSKRLEGPPIRHTVVHRASPDEARACHAAEERGRQAATSQRKHRDRSALALLRRASSLKRQQDTQSEKAAAAAGGPATVGDSKVLRAGASPVAITAPQGLVETEMDEATVKRELRSGRWPFQQPLNPHCRCRNCANAISFANLDSYQPSWTRSARSKWLANHRDGDTKAQLSATLSAPSAPPGSRPGSASTSRGMIQADEVDVKLGVASLPQTPDEEPEEHTLEIVPSTASSGADQLQHDPGQGDDESEADPLAEATAEFKALTANAATIPSDVDGTPMDAELIKEIDSRRNSADSRNSFRHGARSMMRQLEEADRVERRASVERERRRNSASPSVACVGANPQPPASGLSSPYFDIPRTSSPLASSRLTLDPIAEAQAGGSKGPAQPIPSLPRIDDGTSGAAA